MPDNDNKAVKCFKDIDHGGKDDLTEYEGWYSTEAIKYLVHSQPKKQPCVRYIFSSDDFLNEFTNLRHFKNSINLPVFFVSLEPGKFTTSHFIFGILFKDELIIINPQGKTEHVDFYETLAKIKKNTKYHEGIKKIYISEITIQRDLDEKGVNSCGPICVELMKHFSDMEIVEISKMLVSAQLIKKVIREEMSLEYNLIDIQSILPGRFEVILQAPPSEYQSHILKLRNSHLQILQQTKANLTLEEQDKYWDSCLKADEQELIQLLLFKEISIGEIKKREEFKSLQTNKTAYDFSEHGEVISRPSQKMSEHAAVTSDEALALAVQEEEYQKPTNLSYGLSATPNLISSKSQKKKMPKDKDKKENLNKKKHGSKSQINIGNIKMVSEHFQDWYKTYKIIASLIKFYEIPKDKQIALVLHLLHLYYYNAGLSIDEITSLHYQASPFQYRKDNSYLRNDKPQALTVIAAELVKKELKLPNKITPMIIDHENFVNLFENYYQKFLTEAKIHSLENIPCHENTFIQIKEERNKTLEYVLNLYAKYINKLIQIENVKYIEMVIAKEQIIVKIGDSFLRELISKYKDRILEKLNQLKNKDTLTKSELGILYQCYNSSHKLKYGEFQSKIKDSKKAIFSIIENTTLEAIGQYFKEYLIDYFKKEVSEIFTKVAENIVVGYVKEVHGIFVFIAPYISEKNRKNIIDKLNFQNYGYTAVPIKLEKTLLHLKVNPIDFIPELLNAQLKVNNETKNEVGFVVHIQALEKQELDKLFGEIDKVAEIYNKFKESCITSSFELIRLQSESITNCIEKLNIFEKQDISNKVVLWRLTKELGEAIDNANNKNIVKFTRNIQNIHEAILLYLALYPLAQENSLQPTIRQLVSNNNLQGVYLCSYGMKTFSQVFSAAKYTFDKAVDSNIAAIKGPIQVSNQNYYELLLNINNLNSKIYQFKNTTDIGRDAKIIFIDIHPNNAIEAELYGHNIVSIFDHIWLGHQRVVPELCKEDPIWLTYKNCKLTLVIDITLNHIDDEEIKNILAKAKKFIDQGLLNLVLVQSLTKFAQLGMDKLSGGLIIAYNKSEYWQEFNNNLRAYQNLESVDGLIDNYFAVICQFASAQQKEYINKIYSNTRNLYEKILDEYSHLQIKNENRVLEVTINADEKTCYIALNCQLFFEVVNKTNCFFDEDLEAFYKAIVNELIIPIARSLNLPITHRMSFGFPIANINNTAHTIRLTVGMDEENDLKQYAEIIAYVCYALNRLNDQALKEIISDKKGKGTGKRKEIFEDLVKIFKIFRVDTNLPEYLETKLPRCDFTSSNSSDVNFIFRDKKIEAKLQDSESLISEEKIYLDYEKQVLAPDKLGQQKKITLNDLDPKTKCMLAVFIYSEYAKALRHNAITAINPEITELKITNFLCLTNNPIRTVSYQTYSSGLINYNLDTTDHSLTFVTNVEDSAKSQTLSDRHLFISKELLSHFQNIGLSQDVLPEDNELFNCKSSSSSNTPAFMEQTDWYDKKFDDLFAEDRMQFLQYEEESYKQEKCKSFNKLPLDLKKLIFPKLPFYQVLITNNPDGSVVSIELNSRKSISGNGFTIYEFEDKKSKLIYVETELWSIKSPTLAKFCRLLCVCMTFYQDKDNADKSLTEFVGLAYKKFKITKENYDKYRNIYESKLEKVTIVARKHTDALNKFIEEKIGSNCNPLQLIELENNPLKIFQQEIENLIQPENTKSNSSTGNSSGFSDELQKKFTPLSVKTVTGTNPNGPRPNLVSSQQKQTVASFFKFPFSPYTPDNFRTELKRKLINNNSSIMEYLCNLLIFREEKKLLIRIELLDQNEAKNIYKQLGYWLSDNLRRNLVKNFEAKKTGLILKLPSSQEAKDLKQFLKDLVEMFIKENPSYIVFEHSDNNAKTIHLAADFNNWLYAEAGKIHGHSKWQMWKYKNNPWRLVVNLEVGKKYLFKYVLNEEQWENDLTREKEISIEGHVNSVLVVSDSFYELQSNTTNYKILFDQITKSTNGMEQLISNDEATSYGISEALKKIFDDSVYILDPDSLSTNSIFDNDQNKAEEAMTNFIRFINGYIDRDGQQQPGLLVNKKLDKPLLVPLNTTAVEVKDAYDGSQIGGTHWVIMVALPGKEITDPIKIFYVNSCNSAECLPDMFKQYLKEGIGDLIYNQMEDERQVQPIPAPFPEAEFVENPKGITQQKSGNLDCGAWTVYNAAMIVFTGDSNFISNFKDTGREPAFAIRHLFKDILTIDQPMKIDEVNRPTFTTLP